MFAPLARLEQWFLDLLAWNDRRNLLLNYFCELLAFGYKNALSCLFPVFIFGMLGLTKYVQVPFIARYDLLLFACLAMQAFMYFSKMETKDELKVICLFHLLGLGMELFKVNMGSWSYNEPAIFKIFGVPLYSGFMYASVASFMTQAWRRLDLKLIRWPNKWLVATFGAAIYLNFFVNILFFDFRWILIVLVFVLFFKTWIQFNNTGPVRQIPLTLAFLLIALFVWFAENIATFLGAWTYRFQQLGWTLVDPRIFTSWFLLVIVSFILVAELKLVKSFLK
jgi:uncharacterized membrane protein YoaT (DUF817 family)